ncbi:MAG TPA: phosphoribosylanthranilate isomerase [Stellaceae bacterium]|nr:phosphoribosylanthranilate isomerase [Stellaceae bacterium]
MSVAAKICGLSGEEGLAAAIAGGARFVGFVFYPPSPRHLTIERAAALATRVPAGIGRVAVLVDPEDDFLARLVARVPLDLLQLHGKETPERVQTIKDRFRVGAMKAIAVAGEADLDGAKPYFGVADWLMFDAKPPKEKTDAMPGGNALAFDWRLLRTRRWPLPWMLSGGLDPDNLAEAATISGASAVDVSSGVESAPGVKDPAKIRLFLARAQAL